MRICCLVILVSSVVFAQANPEARLRIPTTPDAATTATTDHLTIPDGTKVLLALKAPISTKTAHQGDAVYAETAFPVVANGTMLVPGGTYVEGVIDEVRRSGHIIGKAELRMHFNSLIFSNGYILSIPAAVESLPGAQREKVVPGTEGTIQQTGHRKASMTASSAGTGAVLGGLSNGARGALMGAGIAGAAGFAVASLLRNNNEVVLEPGTTVEMVVKRPLEVDARRLPNSGR